MQVIICYDIRSNKLRSKLVKYLEKIAVRVQYSIFKADLTERKIAEVNNFANFLLRDEDWYRFNIYKVWDSCNATTEEQLPMHYLVF